MFYENLKPFNDQRGVFLNVVDVYSRKAWSEPLTNKTAKSVAEAFKKVLFFGIPEQVQSDKGSEFMGAGDKTKQGIVERFNGTLRDKIDRYLVGHNTNRFIDVLIKFGMEMFFLVILKRMLVECPRLLQLSISSMLGIRSEC